MRRFLLCFTVSTSWHWLVPVGTLMELAYLQYGILMAQHSYIEIIDSEYRFCKYHRLITYQVLSAPFEGHRRLVLYQISSLYQNPYSVPVYHNIATRIQYHLDL